MAQVQTPYGMIDEDESFSCGCGFLWLQFKGMTHLMHYCPLCGDRLDFDYTDIVEGEEITVKIVGGLS